ncbi:reverse transcriptase-like protein [Azoarcus communis]|uniref:ribonuclease HI family protein n=1 Tax=Parazoarcus communis TaxID=41977 RepID=UPI0014594A15|nr:ribonuclease HI family protein [Parazoarcus communis]NMG48631.1 reverse transcriptase-like protein [Parazoarcus communis]
MKAESEVQTGTGEKSQQLWLGSFDGCAWPNPGKIGLGLVLVSPEGNILTFSERALGAGCNNVAELLACQSVLEKAEENGVERLLLHSDSDFVVRHCDGSERTAVLHLNLLVERVQQMMSRFKWVKLCWVPRYRNREADALSRRALGLPPKPAPHPGKRDRKRR